jgi:hypothetical protein
LVVVGHLIEKRGGMAFAEYVSRHLLAPLGMSRSSVLQPSPRRLTPLLAVGYAPGSDGPLEVPQDYSNVAASDGLVTTGTDMARFMLPLLGHSHNEILLRSSILEMQRQQFTYHPRLAGQALGYREAWYGENWGAYGSRRALWHAGERPGFASQLVLVPELGLGIFVASNMRSTLPRVVAGKFLERFHPGASLPAPKVTERKADNGELTGSYRSVALQRGTLERFSGFLSRRFYLDLRRLSEGNIEVDGELTFIEVERGLLQRPNGQDLMAFALRNGTMHLFWGTSAYRRLAWYETRAFHWWVFRFYTGVFLLAFIAIPVDSWLRRKQVSAGERAMIVPQWLAWFTCLWALLFLLTMYIVVETQPPDRLFDYGVPLVLRMLLGMPVVAAVLGSLLLAMLVAMLCRRGERAFVRLICASVVTATAAFVYWTYNWNLFGAFAN